MLLGIPIGGSLVILHAVVGGTPVPWLVGVSLASMTVAYALARRGRWQLGGWLVLVSIIGASTIDMVLSGDITRSVFVALAITIGGLMLRKRGVVALVAVALIAFWVGAQWDGVSFAAVDLVLVSGFLVALALVLATSVGLRESIERARREELARSESRFRGLLEVAFEGLAEIKNGRIVDLNAGFTDVCGRSRSELLGRELSAILTVEEPGEESEREASADHPPHRSSSLLDGRLERPPRPGVLEASGTRPNGEVFYVEMVLRSQINERGPVEYVAIRDITERRRTALQLSIAHRAAALGTLSAGIAHEINNPLSWIMTNLQMIQDELRHGVREMGLRVRDPDGLLTALDDSLQGARQMMTTVRDLKTLSRGEDDEGETDVHTALDLACRVTERQLERRARLVRDYGQVPRVRGSSGRLGQVFLNLLLNAVEAVPEGQRDTHRIRLRTRTRGEVVEVTIRDDGPGIPADVLPRIFDPFFTTKGPRDGTGLGLSITRSIVDGIGGSIEVESREGEGATFTVRLPVADRVVRVAPAPTRADEGRLPAISVLVIDDEPLLGRSLSRTLNEHEVTCVEDPLRALALCDERSFDVILCDLMMPGVSGEEVYEQLREQHPELARRMIFMTGGAFTPRSQRFVERIDLPVLSKPFAPKDLRAVVQRVLQDRAGAA